MTRGDLPRVHLAGRPIKPLALAVALSSFVVFWWNVVLNQGVIVSSVLGDIVGAAGLAAALALVGGWVGRSQRMAVIGLALGTFVWGARALVILFLSGTVLGFWLSMAWVVAAGGAFLLEVLPDEDGW